MTLALSIILVLSSVLMIILVLLHKGKGSGLSDLFGGGVSSTYGGSSVVEKNLDRITIVTEKLKKGVNNGWWKCYSR
jgi:preprotein translocase subunit SecG